MRVTQLVAFRAKASPGERVLARFQFDASGSQPLEVTRLAVYGRGTLDESLFFGGMRAVADANGDGVVDPGDAQLAALAAPAFPVDDGVVDLVLTPPLVVTPGSPAHLLLVLDVLLPTPTRAMPLVSMPGHTIVHGLQDAGAVTARGAAGPVPVRGRFPVTSVMAYQVNDHVLITEVGLNGTDYIELFNPTADQVDLSDCYLADYTAAGAGYHQLPSGSSFAAPRGTDDLLARFPPGASMIPGAVITVALWGDRFQREFNREPHYSGYDTVQQWFRDSLHFPVGAPPTWLPLYHGFAGMGPVASWGDVPIGTFRRRGEAIVLFRWDGLSDLVQDVDMVAWGDAAPPADARHDKTGVLVDGPDADAVPSAYLPDTPSAQQLTLAGPSSGWSLRKALRRVDYLETGERKSGGNGETGHDETSEPWSQTFQLDYPDPGYP